MQKLITKLLVLTALFTLSAFGAKAGSFPQDGSPITSGTTYDVKMFEDYNASFTPTISGTLIQDGCPELKLEGCSETFLGYGKYGQTYTWQVEAGRTYMIRNRVAVLMDGQVSFSMEADQGVNITRIEPEDGSVLVANVNMTGEVVISFNTGVTFENAYLVAGSEQIELENSSMQPMTLALPITEAMCVMYADGTLNPAGGDPVAVQISGLRSTSGLLYNGDGELTLNYTSDAKLIDLVTTNMPNVFKSYYPEGDPEGIWTFVFDGDVLDDGGTYMEIFCGNRESDGMFYYEVIKPEINGATLTFDLTEKLRELDFYCNIQGGNYVGIKINNVRDLEGRFALGSGSGNVGSYDYSPAYNYIQPQAVVCEFDPPTGSSLKDVDEIEIWFNNANMIEFEGVQFTYNTDRGFETTVVLKDELSMSLENNEMTIRVKVPETVVPDQVTVKLYNMTSIDGHTYHIEAKYDMFVVNLLAPIHQGQSIASTGTDDFVFFINFSSYYYYIRYDFYNAPGDEGWVYGSNLTHQTDGTWTAFNGDFPCYSNYNPRLVVSAYWFEDDWNYGREPAETYTFTFVGTQTPFTYSDVHFVSIDPEPWSEIEPEEGFHFTVKYDGLARVNADMSGIMLGMGMGVMPFSEVVPVYDSEEYIEGLANTWLLYPNVSYLADLTDIEISIFAKDENGKVIEGNMGAGEMDCLQLSYMIHSESNMVDVTVDPAPGEISQISGFTVTCRGMDVGINWGGIEEWPRILDENFNIIYTFTEDDMAVSDGQLYMSCPPITDKGNYMFCIPEKALIIGSEFQTYYNYIFFGDYYVNGSGSHIDGIGDVNGTYTVYSLQGVLLKSTADRSDLKDLHPGLYIINGTKVYIR